MRHQLEPGMIANFGSQKEAQRIYDLAKELGVPVLENDFAGAVCESDIYVVFEKRITPLISCYDIVSRDETEITPQEFEARMRGEWK